MHGSRVANNMQLCNTDVCIYAAELIPFHTTPNSGRELQISLVFDGSFTMPLEPWVGNMLRWDGLSENWDIFLQIEGIPLHHSLRLGRYRLQIRMGGCWGQRINTRCHSVHCLRVEGSHREWNTWIVTSWISTHGWQALAIVYYWRQCFYSQDMIDETETSHAKWWMNVQL